MLSGEHLHAEAVPIRRALGGPRGVGVESVRRHGYLRSLALAPASERGALTVEN